MNYIGNKKNWIEKNLNLNYFEKKNLVTNFHSFFSDVKISCINGSEWMCKNGNKCIPSIWKCDKENDCPDGSDEEHCGKWG